MATEDAQLVPLYLAKGLLADVRTPVHLPTQCPRHALCWASEPARLPPRDHVATELSAPWVGSRYSTGRLVLVLENLRDFGGWDLRDDAERGMRYLARLARIDWKGGRRRLFRNKDAGQGGTNVWPQAVSYAATWLFAAGLLAKSWSGDAVPTEVLAEALDLVAVVQHVKCSPIGRRSNANDAMWTECGRYVLRDELAILRPERLIVLGRGHNAMAMRSLVLPGQVRVVAERSVRLGAKSTTLQRERRELSGRAVDMVVVPHPASPGGTSRKLVGAFCELVGRPS